MPARPWLPLLAVLLAIPLSAWVRTHAALGDPNLGTALERGAWKSDPGLLAYLTRRIADAGGRAPDDWRADPRIQHPDATDVPAEFTVGLEFLVAWGWRLVGRDVPLHVFCVRFASVLASLALAGAGFLVWARTRSPGWTVLAVALVAVTPAAYRTIGFLLVREDLSFPLLALHLGLLARAERVRTPAAFLLAGLAAGAALATWHAMGYFLAVELLVLLAGLLVHGRSAFELPGAWATLVGPVAAATLVPALRANAALLGLPLQLAWSLLAVAAVRARRPLGRLASTGLALAVWAAVAGLRALLAPGRGGLSHVGDVIAAKLRHLGVPPEDPTAIPFDARLLWQGPFETLQPGGLILFLGWGLLLLALGLFVAWRGRARLAGFERWLAAFALASLPVAWLIGRTVILAGLLVPVAAAVLLAGAERARALRLVFAAGLLLQAMAFASWVRDTTLPWYLPPGRQAEIAALVDWVEEHVDPDEAIVGDFVNSPAILLWTGNPIALQPKYETEASRRKAQAFLEAFFHGTPEDLHRLVTERFRARHLLVDRYTLGVLSPWTAGLADPTPRPGTAAALLLGQDEEVLTSVPGFELLYRSPPGIRQSNGAPYDLFRLYRLR